MLKKTIQDNIAIAQLSDGQTNAVTLDTLRQLKAVVDEVNDTDTLKGLILTGEGRFFSSGFNLPMFISFETPGEVVDFFTEQEDILVDYFACKKPVVCAMNGHSAALGMILAMASDYRVVTNQPKIKLGMSEIKIGLSLTIAQSHIMRFGLNNDTTFRNMIYFGEMMGVDKAFELGIVDEVVEAENLIERAKEIIRLWIDTPNRPFIRLKQDLKKETVGKIKAALDTENWQDAISAALLNKEVKAALSFVQAAMEKRIK